MLSIIIPINITSQDRFKNALEILKHYSKLEIKKEIILVEQNHDLFKNNELVDKYVSVRTFNTTTVPSKLRNMGVKEAQFTNILIVDADTIISEKNIREGIEAISKKPKCFYHPIHNHIYDLNKEQTEKYYESQILSVGEEREAYKVNKGLRCQGGAIIMKTYLYELLGGFCESFIGYGGEDDEFLIRLRQYGLEEIRSNNNHKVYHLHHEKSETKENTSKNSMMLNHCYVISKTFHALIIQHYNNPKRRIGAIHYDVTAENKHLFYDDDFAIQDGMLKKVYEIN